MTPLNTTPVSRTTTAKNSSRPDPVLRFFIPGRDTETIKLLSVPSMKATSLSTSRTALYLCALAFLLRIAAIAISPAHLWSYTIYYDMARQLVSGQGYCLAPGG